MAPGKKSIYEEFLKNKTAWLASKIQVVEDFQQAENFPVTAHD